MLKLSLSPEIFNRTIKRLILLAGSDLEALVTFLINKDKLTLYYHSKIEKGSNILYYEEVPTTSIEGNGIASIYINQLFSIKIPDFVSNEKFPQCKEVNFKFLANTLTVDFSIIWSKNTKPNETTLNFPLLEKPVEIEEYHKLLYPSNGTHSITIPSVEIIEGIAICNFIKTDVTSRDSNGCLLTKKDNVLSIVSTDSTVAVKWNSTLEESVKEDFSIVTSASTLNAVKSFLSDSEIVTLTTCKNNLLVEVEGRKMLYPLMKIDYIISDVEEFFHIEPKTYVASINLKPFINSLSIISANNNDLYKKVNLDFSTDSLDIFTNINKALQLPAKVTTPQKFCVNAEYILLAAHRLVNFGYQGDIYFDSETHRITFASNSKKLIFLIQGLSY